MNYYDMQNIEELGNKEENFIFKYSKLLNIECKKSCYGNIHMYFVPYTLENFQDPLIMNSTYLIAKLVSEKNIEDAEHILVMNTAINDIRTDGEYVYGKVGDLVVKIQYAILYYEESFNNTVVQTLFRTTHIERIWINKILPSMESAHPIDFFVCKNKHLLDTAVSGMQNSARIYERWLDMQVKIKSTKTDN